MAKLESGDGVERKLLDTNFVRVDMTQDTEAETRAGVSSSPHWT